MLVARTAAGCVCWCPTPSPQFLQYLSAKLGVATSLAGQLVLDGAGALRAELTTLPGYFWWWGHDQVVRPPTVRRTKGTPSRGQTPPGLLSLTSCPV